MLRERANELRAAAWIEPVLIPLGLVAASVLTHLFILWVSSLSAHMPGPSVHYLAKWDGGIYLRIARDGYPTTLRKVPGGYASSPLGFYPLYPAVVRVVFRLGPWNLLTSGLVVAIASTAGAALVFWQLAASVADRASATRAVALLVFSPSAFVLSMTYSEPMFILLACGCLWALVKRRWVLAGVCGFLGCMARPSGPALLVACVVAAFVALRQNRRELRALAAPILSLVGFAVVPTYDRIHTGDFFAYWRTQEGGWHNRLDFGHTTVRMFFRYLQHPFRDFNLFMSGTAIIVIAIGLILMIRWRPPPEIFAYTLVIVGLALSTTYLVSTFRFAMTAVPLWIAYARVLRGNTFLIVLATSVALFAGAAALATTLGYTP